MNILNNSSPRSGITRRRNCAVYRCNSESVSHPHHEMETRSRSGAAPHSEVFHITSCSFLSPCRSSRCSPGDSFMKLPAPPAAGDLAGNSDRNVLDRSLGPCIWLHSARAIGAETWRAPLIHWTLFLGYGAMAVVYLTTAFGEMHENSAAPEAPIFDEREPRNVCCRDVASHSSTRIGTTFYSFITKSSRTNCSAVFPTLWIFTMAAHLSVSWLSPCAECDRGWWNIGCAVVQTNRDPSFPERSYLRQTQGRNRNLFYARMAFEPIGSVARAWSFGLPVSVWEKSNIRNDFRATPSMSVSGHVEANDGSFRYCATLTNELGAQPRQNRSMNFCSSVTPHSHNPGTAAGSFASGTNHGSKLQRKSKS